MFKNTACKVKVAFRMLRENNNIINNSNNDNNSNNTDNSGKQKRKKNLNQWSEVLDITLSQFLV